ncbi:MAG: deoxynucleoside kinase [Chloroflexota bacterium]
MVSKPITICIAGNMASGKTTFARLLGECYTSACYVPEPSEANPFLPLYLQNQVRWGFTAQLRYFWDYVRVFKETTAQQHYHYHFVDAGQWTNRFVYLPYLHESRIITADEYAFYLMLCDTIEQAQAVPEPQGFIFIDSSPLTCWQRMHQRGWHYQVTAVELSYIEALDRHIETMKQNLIIQNMPVLTLSSEEIDYLSDVGRREALDRVQGFLEVHHLAHPH